MDWTEITVKTAGEHCDAAAAVMQAVSGGIYIEDYRNLEENVYEVSHTDLIDDELLGMDRDNIKIHIYISGFENPNEKIDFINEQLNKLSVPFEMNIGKMRDEDWANNWKKYYKPFEVGEKLLIKPVWEEVENTRGKLVLNIEPGLAFGTGTHESTKMCLELLEGSIFGSETILDIGCGTGILSVAALLLGAERAVAVDIDPVAVKAAAANAELNGISEPNLKIIEGDLVAGLSKDEKFDIIIANIVADAIISLSSQIPAHIKHGGTFICSGIIEERLEEVKRELNDNSFRVAKVCIEKGWAAILAKQ